MEQRFYKKWGPDPGEQVSEGGGSVGAVCVLEGVGGGGCLYPEGLWVHM